MAGEIRIPFTQIRIGRFLFLFICILLLMVLPSFLRGVVRHKFLMDLLFSALLISGIYSVSEKKSTFVVALLLGIPGILAHWTTYVPQIQSFPLAAEILGTVFFAYISASILSFIFKEKDVTADLIIGAICAYFLVGLFWSSIYSFMEIVQPGSFLIPEGMGDQGAVFNYFSFVTLTTLGYGDVTPLSEGARALSVLEAAMGQLYIAVLVARLVGVHIAQTSYDAES
jgi:hypothetical protein